jgi:hypothetical protein
MISHPSRSRCYWTLLACLALADATQNEAGAGPVGETGQSIRARSCGQTIQYRIGKIDERFGVDGQRVIAAAAQAAGLWNAAADAKVMEYDAAGSVTIELIYDARQNLMQGYDGYAASIHQEQARLDRMEEEVVALQSQIDAANAAVTAGQNDFGIQRDSYNANVDRLNGIGGGTRGQVRALDQVKLQLNRQESDLNKKIEALVKLNARRRQLVQEHNALVGHVNEMVAAVNKAFAKDIVSGLYIKSGNRATIEIFAFTDPSDLVALLAHEFGHALGLGHSKEPGSIMGMVHKSDGTMAGSLVQLSAGDVAALADVCGR